MTCCAPPGEVFLGEEATPAALAARELALVSRPVGEGLTQTDLSVPGIHCAACISKIERSLGALEGVERARVNFSTRRVSVRWRGEAPPPLLARLESLGYAATPFSFEAAREDKTLAHLIRATAVAGFASSNIMIFSVSVWSGAEAGARDAFHAISALIALPTLLYSGRVFYQSAWAALRRGRMNMDLPIALGVALAFALSLYETAVGGQHAYYDAAVTLIFFLLVGRTLDHMMRERARSAVQGLAKLIPQGALRLDAAGEAEFVPLAEIRPGDRLLIPAGARVPVNVVVEAGRSEADLSVVTGESLPRPVAEGAELEAGALNLAGPLTARARSGAEDSFLGEMLRMMEAAETGRARYRRLADRVSALYAPVVHLAAFGSFLLWMVLDGDPYRATTIAIAVLIITCPCALGLAVPMTQVVAARRLFEAGIMMRDGSALERLETADAVVLDKTGTLTDGAPRLSGWREAEPGALVVAGRLAARSTHPLSRALTRAAREREGQAPEFTEIRELPGLGLTGLAEGREYRLGRRDWALKDPAEAPEAQSVLSRDGELLAAFSFAETLREGAAEAVAALKAQGFSVEIVSGDEAPRVEAVAQALGIETFRAGARPGAKIARLEALRAEGRRPLMIGDGLNDAPALSAAEVSMAPAEAADIGRNAADFVFLRPSLNAVPHAAAIARRAGSLVRQNIAMAILYNVVATPIAMTGHVTPLVAAVAMSSSSVLVALNALRLGGGSKRASRPEAPAPLPSREADHAEHGAFAAHRPGDGNRRPGGLPLVDARRPV
ncbi:heavy metal translocating P-type ATPase [Neomegalonema sp.]|uniref:heavy metal translocating P-type ATPase n=1 Tax=Neomegalonema sp. TaxID=2039713 RepID=UPI0026117E93|nr:heavy metal translocating P-type ATPase [Neomegalonema sp.]MDD2868315.1 heavy metal translocating P-type ATPase [Neomegalonema sp.]